MLAFTAPWGLLALAGIPAVIALHLFRRSFHVRRVSALFLWNVDERHAGGGRTRQPLRQRLSLWCEILACIAFAWFLSDPHLSSSRAGRHLLLVMDTRWSLQAGDLNHRAWDEVCRAAVQRLSQLADDDRATLIASGTIPHLLAGPATSARDVIRALEQLRPDQPKHDIAPAISLAQQLGGTGGEVVVFSDRESSEIPPGTGLVACGKNIPTSGIADAVWTVRRGNEHIVARIVAYGAHCSRGWQVIAGDRVLSQGVVTVEPGSSSLITVPVRGWSDDVVRLQMMGNDALALDDSCVLRRPPPRHLVAHITVPDELKSVRVAAETALQAAGDVIINNTGPAQIDIRTTVEAAQPGLWQLVILAGDGPVQLGPFLARAGHPCLDDVDSTGVVWAGSAAQPGLDETPLLTAGGRVLIGEIRHPDAVSLIVHVDPVRAQLFRHPLWPALVTNWCEQRRAAQPGPERSTVHLHETVSVQCVAGSDLLVTAPDGVAVHMTPDSTGHVSVPGFEQAGTWLLQNAEHRWPIDVVTLDARLADLSEATSTNREPVITGPSSTHHEAPLLSRLLPLMLAAAALVIAWQAYRRESGA